MPGVALLPGIVLGMILFAMTLTAPVHADTISVDIGREAYDVEYTATGMTVSGADADLDLISLILSVDVTDPQATLDVTLDRAFFDSVIDGQDYGFIVLADGDEARFAESRPGPAGRILSISLPIGTEEVEIVGAVFGQPATVPEPGSGQTPESVPEPGSGQTPESVPEPVQVPEADPELPVEPDPGTDESEEIMQDTPHTQCGAGTILEDGVCVLDERCGKGTILEDGVCVLVPSEPVTRAGSGDLAAGSVGGFVAAGIIAVIAVIIIKISRRKRTTA